MNELVEQILGYIRGVWRRRGLVLTIAWTVSVSGWVWIYFLANEYQAQARVYVDTQSLLRPLLSGLTVQPNLDQQITLMTRTLVSRPNLERLARSLDLDLSAKTQRQKEALYKGFEERITIKGTERENLYTISYQNSNPDLAKRVVQEMLTIFTESSLKNARKDLGSTQKFIDEQLKGYEARLLEKEKNLEAFKREHMGALPGQEGGYYAKVGEVNLALEQATLELDEAVNRKKQLQAQLDGQAAILTSTLPVSGISSQLDTRISALQTQLDNLRLRFTDLHPEIIQAKQLIAKLQEQKHQEEALMKKDVPSSIKADNPVYQQLTIAIAEADANAASLRIRVAQLQNKRTSLMQSVDLIPQIESEYTQLMRDYSVFKKNYDELLDRRETAAISQDVESRTDTVEFRVIDPPRVPSRPSYPNRPLLLSAALVVGLALGTGLAFLLGQIRPTIDSRRQWYDLTDYPMLGVVTRIGTTDGLLKARHINLVYGGLFAGLLMVYLVQIVYYLFISEA